MDEGNAFLVLGPDRDRSGGEFYAIGFHIDIKRQGVENYTDHTSHYHLGILLNRPFCCEFHLIPFKAWLTSRRSLDTV